MHSKFQKAVFAFILCTTFLVPYSTFYAIKHKNIDISQTEISIVESSETLCETTYIPSATTGEPKLKETMITVVETTTEKETVTTTKQKTTSIDILNAEKTTEETIRKNKASSSSDSKFRITVYTPESDGGVWGYATATGATSTHLKTCAVDTSVIPFGSIVHIVGTDIYAKAVDTGSAVKGKHIDLFVDMSESDAYDWFYQYGLEDYMEVEIV